MLSWRKGLADLPAYDVAERPWEIKINANESTLGLPPLVEERVMARLTHVAFNRYPNEEYDLLREQLAASYGLKKENVLIGSGSSEIIEKLFFAFGGGGQPIVYPQPSFSMYRIYAKAAEARGVPVPLGKGYRLDPDAFVRAVRESRANLAVLCNPNNPTGNALKDGEIDYIAKGIDCAFLVDEAYMEFCGRSAYGLLAKYPHLMVARTFSKAYSLAAARVGYLLAGEELVRMAEKAYMPYHMNVLSLATADIVYQMRHEYEPRIHMLVAERKRMSAELAALPGFTVFPSETNFVLAHYKNAAALNEHLASKGIGVRSFGDAPGLTGCLRFSMGTREENDAWLRETRAFAEGRA